MMNDDFNGYTAKTSKTPNYDIASSSFFHLLIHPSITVLVIYRWVVELTTTFGDEEQMTSGLHGKTMPNGTGISSRDMNNIN